MCPRERLQKHVPFNDTAHARQEDAQFVPSSNLTIMPITTGSNVDKHTRRIATVDW